MNTGHVCRICGHNGNMTIFIMRETMFNRGEEFTYFQCELCRCLQIAEFPDDVGQYYPQDYYSFSETSRDSISNPLVRHFRKVRNRYSVTGGGIIGSLIRSLIPNRKLTILTPIPLTPSSRILDVGCGSGWRLYALREAGFINTLGVDPYIKDVIQYHNGLRILKKSIHELSGEWDLVMFHHSFEHMPDPFETLSKAAHLLVQGGTCLIRIPQVDSFAWEHYREHWYQIDAPRHYYLHSIKSIGMLAERTGFCVRDIVFDSTLDQFWKSEQNLRNGASSARLTRKEKRNMRLEAARLNRERKGDQAAFYLVKQ